MGITTVRQLTEITEVDILRLHGMGPKAVRILRETLKTNGLSFCESKKIGAGMDKTICSKMDAIFTGDGEAQKESEKPVDWAYAVWDELVSGLTHKDNHVRAICGQLLGNLGKYDPEGRVFKDFAKLLDVTKDEQFITARHTLQNVWKVGLGGKKAQGLVMNGLEKRYMECIHEKNGKLIRYDILVALRNIYIATTSSEIKEKALELIELEDDAKYKKKYASAWKKL